MNTILALDEEMCSMKIWQHEVALSGGGLQGLEQGKGYPDLGVTKVYHLLSFDLQMKVS